MSWESKTLVATAVLGFAVAGCGGGSSSGSGGRTGIGAGNAGAAGHEFLVLATQVGGGEQTSLFDLTAGALVPLPNDHVPSTSFDPSPVDMSDDGRFILGTAPGMFGAPCLHDRAQARTVEITGTNMFAPSALTPDGKFFLARDRVCNCDPSLPNGPEPDFWELPSGELGQDIAADATHIRVLDPAGRVFQFAMPWPSAPIFDAQANLGLVPDGSSRMRLTVDGKHVYFETNAKDVILCDVDAKTTVPLPGLAAWKSARGAFDVRLEDTGRDGRFVLVSCDAAAAPFGPASQLALYDASSTVLAYVPLPGIGESRVWISGRPTEGARVSRDGRYVAGIWADGAAASPVLHVYDRAAGTIVPLPGVDVTTAHSVVLRP